MTVNIYGSVASATYRLLNKNAQELGRWAPSNTPMHIQHRPVMERTCRYQPSRSRWKISAVGQSSDTFVWLSKLYAPTVTSLRIEPLRGVLSKGETVPVTLRLASAGSALGANYTVRLWLPPGFSGAPDHGLLPLGLAKPETYRRPSPLPRRARPLCVTPLSPRP